MNADDAFSPTEGKPTDDDLLALKETLLPLLMVIPYDQLGGVHSLTAILTDPARYATDHGGNNFRRPARLRLPPPPPQPAFPSRQPTSPRRAKLDRSTTPKKLSAPSKLEADKTDRKQIVPGA